MTSPHSTSPLIGAALKLVRPWLVALIAFSAAINLLALTPSIYMMQVYDRVLSSQSQNTLLALTALIIGLYGLAAALEYHRATSRTRSFLLMELSGM